MEDFDVTRMGDHVLAETYFDQLGDIGPDNESVKLMKVELEARDLLFKGYLIRNWVSGYTVEGCVRTFPVLEDLKDYILSRKVIEPVYDGSMHYNIHTAEDLALKAEADRISPELEAKITALVNR